MASLSLRIPDSLHSAIKDFAAKDGYSMARGIGSQGNRSHATRFEKLIPSPRHLHAISRSNYQNLSPDPNSL